ncbi:hypothetical protein ARMGADRAFT_456584 [Armillaria gallica]|uniref:Uncharacterized protein n=1 Tax=Armillaria gallica TaxID=47427 RepID=A0A2H3CWT7_ARMGA|nr:hypothetical protein ARMGADRAFT_456584 [Armillaria gallica]
MTKFFTLVKKKGVETAIPPLEFLKAAAGLISVPALGPATDIVLSIFENLYQSQQNAGAAHEIANMCLRAHSTLSEHLLSVEITPALLNSIRQFEADLHDAQETVQKYKQKMWFQHVFYSRSNNDDLQRLEKRVLHTLSLFQIKSLLSLREVNRKINESIQRVEQNTVGNTAYLQRIEQNTVVLMNQRSELAPRPEGASVDTVPGGHITLCEEITSGPGYSLQKAEMGKKAVVIKVFTGCQAKSMWEAAVKSESIVMHANRPHVIEISSADERVARYLVYDLDIKDSVEGVILSWMSQDVDEIMYMCAKMIHGISSALNNLSEQARLFDMDAESFDILWDARDRVVLSLRPEVATSLTALAWPKELRLLRVMDDICAKVGTPVCLA